MMAALPGLVPEDLGAGPCGARERKASPVCGADYCWGWAAGDAYCGFVRVHGRDYFVRVFKDGRGIMHLEADRELQRLLQCMQVSIRQRLDRSADVDDFLEELKDILERISIGSSTDAPPRADAMRCIVEEIEEVGWERVHSINEHMQVVPRAARTRVCKCCDGGHGSRVRATLRLTLCLAAPCLHPAAALCRRSV